MATPDLRAAYRALVAKQAPYTALWAYYEGDHPLVYASSKVRDLFSGRLTRFSENWCAVVVDALLDRLTLKGFEGQAVDELNDFFTDEAVSIDADEAHRSAAVTGEGFVIVEQRDDGTVELFENDSRLCHIVYAADNPRRKAWAAKWWEGEDERRYLTLYYPDRFEHYVSAGKAKAVQTVDAFVPAQVPVEANESGVIPVFCFRRSRKRILGELHSIIDLQNAVNKLFADMMVSAEFAAFRQRWVLSNADLSDLLTNPNETWVIPKSDKEMEPTQIGSFDPTDLANFTGALDNLASKIAIISRTPKQYLLQAGDISGEALLAMEAPLVKKAASYQQSFGATWREVAVYVSALQGKVLDPRAIAPVWADERTIQPVAEADALLKNRSAGIPLLTLLRRDGWSAAEIEQFLDDQEQESAAQATSLAEAALRAARDFERGEA